MAVNVEEPLGPGGNLEEPIRVIDLILSRLDDPQRGQDRLWESARQDTDTLRQDFIGLRQEFGVLRQDVGQEIRSLRQGGP